MIGEILFFVGVVWVASGLFAVVLLLINDEDVCVDRVDSSVIFLFPANLIFIIKYWWKAIVKAIKS